MMADFMGQELPTTTIASNINLPVHVISDQEWSEIKELFQQANYRSIVIPSDGGIDFEIVPLKGIQGLIYLERVSIGQDSLMEMGLEE